MERERIASFYAASMPRRYTADDSIENLQQHLLPVEALISLYFGEPFSCMWVLTDNHFEHHRLASAKELIALTLRFRRSVEFDSNDHDLFAAELYQSLFGGLSAHARRKPQWLVAADDALFDVPFAALVLETRQGIPVYLMQPHSTARIPSALLLSAPSTSATPGPFLGISDGVYNTADSRWTGRLAHAIAPLSKPPQQLARLAASGKELMACAREWQSSTALLLTGLDATTASVQASLKNRPAVIHIAAHVIQPENKPEQAVTHLGLSAPGQAQILAQDDIAKLDVSGSTVVMSGCSSAALKPVPGVAILGLSRAWLFAGARAVAGSRWATPDDTGELFQAFYRELRNRCDRGADGRVVGASLQRAQQEMLRRGATWRSNPNYWGAFYVVEKE